MLVAGEDSSEGAVVQRKGRFQVTSADLNPKVYTLCLLALIVRSAIIMHYEGDFSSVTRLHL